MKITNNIQWTQWSLPGCTRVGMHVFCWIILKPKSKNRSWTAIELWSEAVCLSINRFCNNDIPHDFIYSRKNQFDIYKSIEKDWVPDHQFTVKNLDLNCLFAQIGDTYMVEGWIKNLPKSKNFVWRIYVEMPTRHLNMILQ